MTTQYERCGAAQIWRDIGGRDYFLVCVLPKGHDGDHAADEITDITEAKGGERP